MKWISVTVLGLEMSQWHSASHYSSGAIHCPESRHTGRFFFRKHMPHCEQAFAYTSVQKYWKGGDLWEHTKDLTACHSYDKAAQWWMSGTWVCENTQEMCCISIMLSSTFLIFSCYMVRYNDNMRVKNERVILTVAQFVEQSAVVVRFLDTFWSVPWQDT